MDDVTVLKKARNLIKKGWGKHLFKQYRTSKNRNTYPCYCAWGAIRELTITKAPSYDTIDWDQHERLSDMIREEIGFHHIPTWNDAPERRKRDVIALYDRLIEKAEQNGQG